MKKQLCLFLALIMTLLLCGCCISHDWQEATCTEPKTCAKCGKTSGSPLGHDYSEWKVVSKASFLAAGKQEKTCSRCGDTLSEEIPKLSTENCLIVDDNGMTVTYEECYYLFEEILSGRTGQYNSSYSYSFSKGSSDNIRTLNANGTKTGIMISLMKNGDLPGVNDEIDYIIVMLVGDSATIKNKTPIFQMCSIAAIYMTHPEVNSLDDAIPYYNMIVENTSTSSTYKEGVLEYFVDTSSIGTNMYLQTFGVRVAANYS